MKTNIYVHKEWSTNWNRADAVADTFCWYIVSIAICFISANLALHVHTGSGIHFIVDYALFAWYLFLILEIYPSIERLQHIKMADKLGLLEEVK